MDKIAQRLFGFAAIVFAFAALIYSTNPATAAKPDTEYETGKYMMDLVSTINSSGTHWWYILVWDTETGRSKMYYGSDQKGSIIAAGSSYNLPSSPL